MTWVRFDDNFYEHPEIYRLSDAAFRMWTAGIGYCARHTTDGFIERSAITILAGGRKRKKALQQLLAPHGDFPPLWTYDEARVGYVVRDYLKWNQSRLEVEQARADARRRKADWQRRKDDGEAGDDDGEAGTSVNEARLSPPQPAVPAPARASRAPVDTPKVTPPVAAPAEDRGTRSERSARANAVGDGNGALSSPAPSPTPDPIPEKRAETTPGHEQPRAAHSAHDAPTRDAMAVEVSAEHAGEAIADALRGHEVLCRAESEDKTVPSGGLERLAMELEGKRVSAGARVETIVQAIEDGARDLASEAAVEDRVPTMRQVGARLGRYVSQSIKTAKLRRTQPARAAPHERANDGDEPDRVRLPYLEPGPVEPSTPEEAEARRRGQAELDETLRKLGTGGRRR
jgi:hypothetical protein